MDDGLGGRWVWSGITEKERENENERITTLWGIKKTEPVLKSRLWKKKTI